jgi:hypothetical protein
MATRVTIPGWERSCGRSAAAPTRGGTLRASKAAIAACLPPFPRPKESAARGRLVPGRADAPRDLPEDRAAVLLGEALGSVKVPDKARVTATATERTAAGSTFERTLRRLG